jgi:transcriptional regulator with XRE-family HTH domain
MPTRPSHDDPRHQLWERRRSLVGGTIRQLRAARGLTQEELAERAGLDRTMLVAVERGLRGLLYERLFDIADALDVPVTDLFRDA